MEPKHSVSKSKIIYYKELLESYRKVSINLSTSDIAKFYDYGESFIDCRKDVQSLFSCLASFSHKKLNIMRK